MRLVMLIRVVAELSRDRDCWMAEISKRVAFPMFRGTDDAAVYQSSQKLLACLGNCGDVGWLGVKAEHGLCSLIHQLCTVLHT